MEFVARQSCSGLVVDTRFALLERWCKFPNRDFFLKDIILEDFLTFNLSAVEQENDESS